MSEAINDLIEELKDDFEMFEQWTDRYGYIIDLGKGLELLADEYHANEYLVEGCQSRLWLHTEFNDGKMYIYADSDSLIVKGLASLLIRVYSGQRPENILNNPPDFFKDLGLEANLSPSRTNGLNSMIQKINILAESYLKISKS